jgi:aldehyde:ferredoxin oxidoreductase
MTAFHELYVGIPNYASIEKEGLVMYKGAYTGKTLWVDLTNQKAEIKKTDPNLAIMYLGGAGFGIKLLYDLVKPGTDPLGPENVLIFAPGPLSGTSSPCSSRLTITGRSPQTGAVGMSTSGGEFPASMKQAGFDAIVLQGKSEKPVYLQIFDENIRFRSAEKLWGMNTVDTQMFIKEDLGDLNYRIACIGQPGEKLSLMAAIINERRASARKGLGAVMGSKNLKAVAVLGKKDLAIAYPDRYKSARSDLLKRFKNSKTLYKGLAKYGTSDAVDVTVELGIFPTKNFTATGIFGPIEDIGYERQAEDIVRRNPCYNCPVGCSQVRIARTGDYAGTLTEGPEFEASFALAGATGVSDLSALYLADRLCDDYGLDNMSVGNSIAFAMELYERQILTSNEVDGLDLRFGNHHAMITMIHHMAMRIGFGDILADGAVAAAKRIGRDTEQYAMHVKKLELPGYDVRGAKAHGLNYMTSYTGADHNRGYSAQDIFAGTIPNRVNRLELDGKADLCKWNQVLETVLCDCSTFCSFLFSNADSFFNPIEEEGTTDELTQIRIATITELLSSATGIEFTPLEIIRIGERVNVLARCFNIREGFIRKDDYLPKRLAEEGIPGGPSKGARTSKEDQDRLLDEYYAAFGYDSQGIPSLERLNDLGLSDVGKEFIRLGLISE